MIRLNAQKKNEAHFIIEKGCFEDLKAIYPSYSAEFPANERKSLEHFKMLMANPNYKLLLIKDTQTKEKVGYALVYVIQEVGIIWLDFLAIESAHQGKGIGSIIFTEILHYFGEKHLGMFMEVEIPNGEDVNQVRRLKYYERLGCIYLDLNYQLPTPEGGFPMHLLYKGIDPSKTPSGAVIKEAIKSCYSFIHSDLSCADKVFEEVIKTIK